MGLADEAPPYRHARGETDQHTRTSGAVDATRTTCGGDNDGQGGAMAPHLERALRVRGESPEGDGDGMMVSRSGVERSERRWRRRAASRGGCGVRNERSKRRREQKPICWRAATCVWVGGVEPPRGEARCRQKPRKKEPAAPGVERAGRDRRWLPRV